MTTAILITVYWLAVIGGILWLDRWHNKRASRKGKDGQDRK